MPDEAVTETLSDEQIADMVAGEPSEEDQAALADAAGVDLGTAEELLGGTETELREGMRSAGGRELDPTPPPEYPNQPHGAEKDALKNPELFRRDDSVQPTPAEPVLVDDGE